MAPQVLTVSFRLPVLRIVLVLAMLGVSQMATAGAPQTVEKERDDLFTEGTELRERLIRALDGAQRVRVTPREAVLRTTIRQFEEQGQTLNRNFVAYDVKVTTLIQRLATAQQVATPQGAQEPINLNTQFQFAIYSTQLSGHREVVRAALRDFSELVASRRSEANSLVALMVSLLSIFVALFLGVINIFAR